MPRNSPAIMAPTVRLAAGHRADPCAVTDPARPPVGAMIAGEFVVHGWDLRRAAGRDLDSGPGHRRAGGTQLAESAELGRSDGHLRPAVACPPTPHHAPDPGPDRSPIHSGRSADEVPDRPKPSRIASASGTARSASIHRWNATRPVAMATRPPARPRRSPRSAAPRPAPSPGGELGSSRSRRSAFCSIDPAPAGAAGPAGVRRLGQGAKPMSTASMGDAAGGADRTPSAMTSASRDSSRTGTSSCRRSAEKVAR